MTESCAAEYDFQHLISWSQLSALAILLPSCVSNKHFYKKEFDRCSFNMMGRVCQKFSKLELLMILNSCLSAAVAAPNLSYKKYLPRFQKHSF